MFVSPRDFVNIYRQANMATLQVQQMILMANMRNKRPRE